ncbi:GTPase IMAP family member 9-like [Brachyhypopomus gauderio]|uniref:GTPase IMAP family member 9-like n=1 Tax=Brachyhypopomus gauderio TaxID=698409 RepID=UPI0040425ACB
MGQTGSIPKLPQGSRGQLLRQHTWDCKSAGRNSTLQLVLIGPNNSGKSSLGNSILGRKAFETGGKTSVCRREHGEISSRAVTVVDTPGLTGKQERDEKVMSGIANVCEELPESTVVFLLVVPLSWNVKKPTGRSHMLSHMLDKVSHEPLIVLVTHEDGIHVEQPKHCVLQEGGLLELIVEQCGGHFHLVNTAKVDHALVSELLQEMENVNGEVEAEEKPTGMTFTPEGQTGKEEFKREPHFPKDERETRGGACGEAGVTEVGSYIFKQSLQDLVEQMRRKRKEEDELDRGRILEYKEQLQQLREKMTE